jgi:AsmA protein
MRRPAAWAGVVIVTAAVAVLGFAPWPLSAKRVAEALNATTGASAPVRWGAPDAATFRALPWPSLSIVGLRLDDALGANLISAPEARLDLSPGELVKGRLAPVRASLVTPIVTLDLDRPPWSGREARGEERPPGASAPLGGLSLTNGVLRVVSRRRGLDTVIENVQGRVDGLAAGDRIRVNLSALWRDAPISISGSLDNLERAGGGEPSAFMLALVSPIANLSFSGTLAGGEAPSVAGDVSATVPSVKALARIVGADPPSFVVADDAAVVGKLQATPNEATLADATVTSARQTVQGALRVEGIDGRPSVSGSFDGDRLAIAPFVGPAPPLLNRDGGWSLRPLALAPPRNFDLDLRLSAGRIDVYGRELADAAASAILKDGVLTLSLVEAAAYGGRLQGETRIACLGEDVNIHARARLSAADFGAAFSDLVWLVPSGQGTLEFALETTGASPAALLAGLGGSAALKLDQGAVTGVNLEEALRRSQRRPIDVARDMRIGGTAFDTFALEFALGHGIAHVVNGELAARGVAAKLQGQVDLAAQSWDLHANAIQTDAAGQASKDGARLSFNIEGPWTSPTIRATGDRDDVQPNGSRAAP